MELTPRYTSTELGIIPQEWGVKKLGDLGTIVRGGSPRPAGDPRYFDGDFIPWLTVAALTNIPEHQTTVTETTGFLTELGSKHSRILSAGSVIIANSGATLGVAKVLGVRCCANDGIAAVVEQRAGVKRFVCYYVNTRTKYLRDVVASGNGQPNLNTGLIREIAIPFPPQAEQQAIADALSEVDALLDGLTRLIAKKRDLKQAAMQQLLTHRTRLRGFHGEWKAKRLGELGSFLKGSGVKKEEATRGSLPCIRYGEIYTAHENLVRQFRSWITPEVARTATRLKAGDLLFTASGETKEEIGKCVAFVDNDEAYAGGDIVILRAVGVDASFMGYYLNTTPISAQKASKGQGDAVVHIGAKALASIRIVIPELDEQIAIAGVLTDMDAEIDALEARLDKTRALKQAMMQELLTGRTRLV